MQNGAIPSKIGKYEIIRVIAQSNDIVYEAWDSSTSRRAAVKVLRVPTGASTDQSNDRVERFKREARAAGKLIHPNIATVFEVGSEGSTHYIAMEFVEGATLSEVISRSNGSDLPNILSIVQQLLRALECSHAAGVVHRDVKPQNVFLTKAGVIKLADFGIARIEVEPSLTIDGQIFGTPSYMAPEQIVGGMALPTVDLWAVGIIAFELATGELPFVGLGVIDVFHKIQTGTPDYSRISDLKLRTLIERLLAKDPARRLQTAREAIDALESINTKSTKRHVRSRSVSGQLTHTNFLETKGIAVLAALIVIGVVAFMAGRITLSGSSPDVGASKLPQQDQSYPQILDEVMQNVEQDVADVLAPTDNIPPDNITTTDDSAPQRMAMRSDASESNSRRNGSIPANRSSGSPYNAEPDSRAASRYASRVFILGSSEDEVLSVQGTPSKITDYGSRKTLHYGYSDVMLTNGFVSNYNNLESNLKVEVMPKVKSDARFFTLGSTEDEVLSVQGTPSKITDYGSRKTLHYGYSDVMLTNGFVSNYNNLESNLKVK